MVVTEECKKALNQRHDYRFNIIEAKRTSPKFGFLLVSAIFEDWNLFELFKIDRVVLRRFVQKVFFFFFFLYYFFVIIIVFDIFIY